MRRVKRDPNDPAKLARRAGRRPGRYLPAFAAPCPPGAAADADCAPIQPEWAGQESAAFADSWSVGMSFYHNVFAREHNAIVDAFRQMAREHPDADSGLRNPAEPTEPITWAEISDDELFQVARLIVAAEIAKIHTIEWTTQLLYDEPLNLGMNSNWSGLFEDDTLASEATKEIVAAFADSDDPIRRNQLYSAFAAGAGIVGRGNSKPYPAFTPEWLSIDYWDLANPDDVNGGTNHFGTPFNFPEEFTAVYRLHALLPDMLEFRDVADANAIAKRVPVVDTFRGKATAAMQEGGLANWALTMGRQRLGLLLLRNHPQFLQNLDLRPRLDTTIDLAALDIIRDREHGVPRFNEFRRQIGLKQLTGFDDFIDVRLPPDSDETKYQRALVEDLRAIYGQHVCDASKVITAAQLNDDGSPINDCLGHPDGSARRQHRGPRPGGRLPRRDDAAARLRHLRDPVPHLHPQRLAASLQRPLPHLEFPAGVLHDARHRLGDGQRPDRQAMGGGRAQRPQAGGLAAEAGAASRHARSSHRSWRPSSTPSTPGPATAASTIRSPGSRGRGPRATPPLPSRRPPPRNKAR